MRMVEPELPQSSASCAAWKLPPVPVIETDVSWRSTMATERGCAGQAAGAVGTGGEIGKVRGALSERAEQCIAVRDAFVTGKAQAADQVLSRQDSLYGLQFGTDVRQSALLRRIRIALS